MDIEHQILNTIVERILSVSSPSKIILFGSAATGEMHSDSDIDLLVVMPLSTSKAAHELEIREALRAYRTPKDVVVTTPEAFAWRRVVPGTIERSAVRSGRVLYEKR